MKLSDVLGRAEVAQLQLSRIHIVVTGGNGTVGAEYLASSLTASQLLTYMPCNAYVYYFSGDSCYCVIRDPSVS